MIWMNEDKLLVDINILEGEMVLSAINLKKTN